MHDRICPECSLTLRPRNTGEFEIDVCPGCEGIWFDAGEFDALVARRYAGKDLENDIDQHKFVRLDAPTCPNNHPQMLGINFQNIEIDHCRTCRGFWLGAAARAALSQRPTVEYTPGPQTSNTVECAACGDVVYRKEAVLSEDKFWCNACVLRGNYPGARMGNAHRMMSHQRIAADHRQESIYEKTQHLRRIHSPFESALGFIFEIFYAMNKNRW